MSKLNTFFFFFIFCSKKEKKVSTFVGDAGGHGGALLRRPSLAQLLPRRLSAPPHSQAAAAPSLLHSATPTFAFVAPELLGSLRRRCVRPCSMLAGACAGGRWRWCRRQKFGVFVAKGLIIFLLFGEIIIIKKLCFVFGMEF